MFESMAGPLARAQIDERHRVASARRKDHDMHPAAAAYTARAHIQGRLSTPTPRSPKRDRRGVRLVRVRVAISALFAQASRTEVWPSPGATTGSSDDHGKLIH